jgi:hypothetical protein
VYLTVGSANVNMDLPMAVKPATVTATQSLKGTCYVWNATGSINTSMATTTSKPYTAAFSLLNPGVQPNVYYFTTTNVFATSTSATVTPGSAYAVTVK